MKEKNNIQEDKSELRRHELVTVEDRNTLKDASHIITDCHV